MGCMNSKTVANKASINSAPPII